LKPRIQTEDTGWGSWFGSFLRPEVTDYCSIIPQQKAELDQKHVDEMEKKGNDDFERMVAEVNCDSHIRDAAKLQSWRSAWPPQQTFAPGMTQLADGSLFGLVDGTNTSYLPQSLNTASPSNMRVYNNGTNTNGVLYPTTTAGQLNTNTIQATGQGTMDAANRYASTATRVISQGARFFNSLFGVKPGARFIVGH
jgi:hypothetical protein